MKTVLLASLLLLAAFSTPSMAQDAASPFTQAEITELTGNLADCWSAGELARLNGRAIPARLFFDEEGKYSGISLTDRSAMADPVYRSVAQSLIQTFRTCKRLRAPERLKGRHVEVLVNVRPQDFRDSASNARTIANTTPPAGEKGSLPIKAIEGGWSRSSADCGRTIYTIHRPGEFLQIISDGMSDARQTPREGYLMGGYLGKYVDEGDGNVVFIVEKFPKIKFRMKYNRLDATLAQHLEYDGRPAQPAHKMVKCLSAENAKTVEIMDYDDPSKWLSEKDKAFHLVLVTAAINGHAAAATAAMRDGADPLKAGFNEGLGILDLVHQNSQLSCEQKLAMRKLLKAQSPALRELLPPALRTSYVGNCAFYATLR
ncbi:hypothetical protein FE88_17035 [Azospirillum brasilense]|nr:hypothetical protein FE88_17035 [Azospirillum brasilense]TVZ48946.1 hypothetical protein OH82_05516 [Azospirillum brasilense]TWB74704.1 hypothetical protein FBZ81_113147 [Azospirillum brasilense]